MPLLFLFRHLGAWRLSVLRRKNEHYYY